MENLPVDHFVTSMQFTARTHRDVYPAIDPKQPALSQKGKVVIITGASQGLGARGFVPSFAATGPKALVLVARSAEKLQAVADNVAKSYPNVETLIVPTNLGDPASIAALFEKVKQKYGHADVLINNAAVFGEDKAVKDVDQQGWWDAMVIFSPSSPPSLVPQANQFLVPQRPRRLPHNTTLPQAPPFPRHARQDRHHDHRRSLHGLPQLVSLWRV